MSSDLVKRLRVDMHAYGICQKAADYIEALEAEVAWRMDAYYYGFTPTGVTAIDKILSAVACAGKDFHNTADWTDEAEPYPHLRGTSCAEMIQNAANDAAAEFRSMPLPPLLKGAA